MLANNLQTIAIFDSLKKDIVTNTYLILDERRANKNGEFPIKLRIIHNRKSAHISTGYSVKKTQWGGNRIKKSDNRSSELIDKINTHLNKIVSDANLAIEDNLETNNEKSINEIKDIITGKSQSTDNPKNQLLRTWVDILVQRKNTEKSFNTGKWYRTSTNSLIEFSENPNLRLNQVTTTLLKDFIAYCIGKGMSVNGYGNYLRGIRAVINKANEEYSKINLSPFDGIKIKHQRTKKRAIPLEIVRKLRNIEFPNLYSNNGNLFKVALSDTEAVCYVGFSFDNMGMNFIDIAKLKKSQLKNAVYKDGKLISCFLEYTRSKQKRSDDPKSFRIKQTEKAIKILNYFGISEKKENDFVFPLQLDNNYASHQTYKQRLKRINNRLTKIVQDQLGYKEEVCTSYVLRHTWATLASKHNIPVEKISAGMGHKSIETTQIYLAELENEIIDDVNEQIVELTEI